MMAWIDATRAALLAVVIVSLGFGCVKADDEPSQLATATNWGPQDHGLALALDIPNPTVHVGAPLPASFQIVNRLGTTVYISRTAISADYAFTVRDSTGQILPPSKHVPLDSSVNGATGHGDPIEPGRAYVLNLDNILGYVEFPAPGAYTVQIASLVPYNNSVVAHLVSKPVFVTVLP